MKLDSPTVRKLREKVKVFKETFDSESKCRDHLYKLQWPNGFRCPQCKGKKHYRPHKSRSVYQCKKCGYQASVRTGLIFENSRVPLPKWFQMIILAVNVVIRFKTTQLQRNLDVTYVTACKMRRKINKTIKKPDAYKRLGGLVEDELIEKYRRRLKTRRMLRKKG